MRPYLAVVKDSFREALASRVLWIMLILIGLFLAAIAPFGWKESLAYRVHPDEIRRVDEFIDYLSKPSNQANPSVKQIRALLSDEVLKVSESRRGRFQQRYQLAEKLTEAIEEGELEVDSWDITFGDEGSALQSMGSARTIEQNRRLNRLALGKAFTRYVKQAPDGTVAFQWGGMDLGLPALPKKAAREIVGIWTNVIIQLIAGAAGVFVGVLVTASIIPNTFDAGSVYLLLSKPISRPLLYLAKFIGGCSFVLINASLLISGVWLVVGVRFDEWNHRLLLCIPIFLFLFAIYYSVSGLAGLIWRNTIVCVGICILFWALCWGLGAAKGGFDIFVHEPNRVVQVTSTPDGLFALSNSGAIRRWKTSASDWEEVVEPPFNGPGPMISQSRTVLPAYDAPNGYSLFVRDRNQLCKLNTEDLSQSEVYDSLPSSIRKILREVDGRLLFVGDEVYRISDDIQKQAAVEQPKIFGFSLPKISTARSNFEVVTIERVADSTANDDVDQVTMDLESAEVVGNLQRDALVIRRDDEVVICNRTESGYAETTRLRVDTGDQKSVMNSLGDFVVIAIEDGTVQLVNIDDPTSIKEFTPFGTNQPRYVRVSADGRFVAVLFHSQQVWLYDVEKSVELSSGLRRQKNISGIGFNESGESATFMAVDRIDRVTEYELPSLRVIATTASTGTFTQRISWYALDPLTKICPQPSGLGSTVDYVISGKTSANIGDGSSLNQAQIKFDPWGPVWSSAAFMIVVLIISCIYIHRQDY